MYSYAHKLQKYDTISINMLHVQCKSWAINCLCNMHRVDKLTDLCISTKTISIVIFTFQCFLFISDSLFELLLDLSIDHRPEMLDPPGLLSISSLSCACLLSLIIASGNTGKMLSGIAAILMSAGRLSQQAFKVSLSQRNVALWGFH